MAGFIRRFGFFPGTEQITLIEGVIIVDLPPPGSVQGVGTGTVALVGEFSDMTYATAVDSSGNVTTKAQPIEIFSSQDMINKVGGFDSTLGEFGVSLGNGFVALRNKTYSRLVLVPINLSSALGARVFRKLPSNTSATNANPVVPIQPATVLAATEFKNGADRARLSKRVAFTGDIQYAQGVDGIVTPAGLPAPTQIFNSPGASFITSGVKKGDAIVLDVAPPAATSITDNPLTAIAVTANVVSTAGYPVSGTIKIGIELIDYAGKTATSFTGLTRGAHGTIGAIHALGSAVTLINDADTFRVVSVTDANNIVIEKQDGTSFTATTWLTATLLPWRLHVASTADSGGNHDNSQAAAYTMPVRPLDATIPASTELPPTIVPPALTSTSWDPLSGLGMLANNGAGIVYNATLQAPNAAASASMDALYATAIDSLLSQQIPARDVNILDVARTSANIRSKQKSHVLLASSTGVGRSTVLWPAINQVDTTVVEGDSDPGAGANRDERVDYSWPGVTTFVPEAVNFTLTGADGMPHSDGTLDVPGAGWLVSVMSNLPPERNPGQAGPPVPTVLAPVNGLQRGLPRELDMNDYIAFRQRGICAIRIDRTVGPIFQSGITTSLISGQKNINRRRIADFIEDSLAQRLVQFAKLPMTTQLKDGAEGEANAFLDGLLSINNPAAQRISDFNVDPRSGNTPDLEAKGIFVLIVSVRSLATADFIILQASIGEGVVITRA